MRYSLRLGFLQAISAFFLLAWLMARLPSPAYAQNNANVLTYHNDNARTGANLNETILTPANVEKNNFGLLFTCPVDGFVYAQPLYVANVAIPGKGTHNVVYICTTNNYVYAFDADSPSAQSASNGMSDTPQPLWQVNLGPPAPANDTGANQDIGIVGTPVIDPNTGTLYLVAKTKENGVFYHRLHALDITSGAQKPGSPVVIQASVSGTGDGSVNGVISLDPLYHLQRPGLLLLNGLVHIAWASHFDRIPYHGWVTSYDAATLRREYVFCTTPNGKSPPIAGGGIWQSGGAPAADSDGFIYFMTGNGAFSANQSGGKDYGDSVLKLGITPENTLDVLDYFTPYNQDHLNRADVDLGSSGIIILPDSVGSAEHPHLMTGTGKEGKIYLFDRTNLGGYRDPNLGANSDDQIVQVVPEAVGGLWSMPAYFHNTLYYQGNGDFLKAFSIANGQISTTPIHQSTRSAPYPGTTPSVSANGAAADPMATGIVWTIEAGTFAILHAYKAADLSQELYNSNQMGVRDRPGGYVKFTTPTIANGKVYVGVLNGVAVYGNAQFVATPVITPNGGQFTQDVSVQITVATAGAEIHYTTDGSDPTLNSPVYTGPFTLSSCTQVKARAFKSGYHASGIPVAAFIIDQGPGDGDGLLGAYYNNVNLSGTPVTRVDPILDFSWGGNSPLSGINATGWSARWIGWLLPRCSGEYTFTTLANDAVRLWVNDQLLIDKWAYRGSQQDTGQITLVGGQKVPIKVEYFQGTGDSMLRLYWSSMGQARTIVPQSQLFSGLNQAAVLTPMILPQGGTFRDLLQVRITDDTPGAEIHYTLDGSEPTRASRLYTGPFLIGDIKTVRARAFKSGYLDSAIASETYTLNVNAPTYALNSGGTVAFPFSADAFFDGGAGHSRVGEVDTSAVTSPAPLAVYQAERFGTHFSYALPDLTPGQAYQIRLHFEDSDYTSVGQRVFNVSINGQSVLTNFDIIAAAGSAFKAIVKEFSATADSSGNITIAFDGVVESAKISGIEVISLKMPKVMEPPTITPSRGLFLNSVTVTMSTSVPGGVIRYTTDGTIPSIAKASVYTGPIVLTKDTLIKARTYQVGHESSDITQAMLYVAHGVKGGKRSIGGPGGGVVRPKR